MTQILKQAISEARRFSEHHRNIQLRAPGGSSAGSGLLAGSGSGGGILGGNSKPDRSAEYQGWAYVAIQTIAQRIAGQPIRIGRYTAKPNKVDAASRVSGRKLRQAEFRKLPAPIQSKAVNENGLEILDDHPLLDLIYKPNPLMTQWHLIFVTIANLELAAKSYIWYERKGQKQSALWPLPPSWVSVKAGSDPFRPTYEIKNPNSMSDDGQTVDWTEMAYFSLPDPSNPSGSFSPTDAQPRQLRIDRAIQQTTDQYYSRGVHPSVVLTVGDEVLPNGQKRPRTLNSAQRRQLVNLISQMYQGVSKAGDPMILDALITDMKQWGATGKELDFLNSSEAIKRRILQTYRVNPITIGEIIGGNRAQAVVADQNLCDNALNPLIEQVNQVLTCHVAPLWSGDDSLAIWIEPCTVTDVDTTRQQYDTGYKSGYVTKNEARHVLGLPPVDDGDEFFDPGFGGGFDFGPAPGDPADGENPGDAPEDSQDSEDDSEDDGKNSTNREGNGGRDNGRHPSSWFRSNLDGMRARIASLTNVLAKNVVTHKEIAELFLKAHSRFEKPYAKAADALFAKQYEAAAKELRRHSGELTPAVADRIFNPRDWHKKVREMAEPWIARALAEGAAVELAIHRARRRRHAETIGSKRYSFEDDELIVDLPDRILQSIRRSLDRTFKQPYWKDISNRTSREIRTIIEDSIENGKSIDETVDDILAKGRIRSETRARAMARTETTGALNDGHQASMKMLQDDGLVTGKEWLSVRGTTTRDGENSEFDHFHMHGEEVKDVEADFDVSGEPAPYPGHYSLSAGNRINCFPAGTLVEGRFEAATKAFYRGQITEIKTRRGFTLAATPNHPVLTEHGMVAMGSLHKGQKLLTTERKIDSFVRELAGRDQVDHKPAAIENIFEAFLTNRTEFGSIEVRCSHAEDFDGDGRFLDGEIEVVCPDWKLREEIEATVFEKRQNRSFIRGHVSPLELGNGSYSQRLCGVGLSTSRGLSGSDGSLAILDARADIPQFLSIGVAANFDAALFEASNKEWSREAGFAADLLERCAGLVSLDEIVEIRNFSFADHVYDLQSPGGWLTANGIIASNCQCTILSTTVVSDIKPDE